MAIDTDVQEILQDLFQGDLLDEGVTKTGTWHSRTAVAGDFDPYTGSFAASEQAGDGALWFDDLDNSMWITGIPW